MSGSAWWYYVHSPRLYGVAAFVVATVAAWLSLRTVGEEAVLQVTVGLTGGPVTPLAIVLIQLVTSIAVGISLGVAVTRRDRVE